MDGCPFCDPFASDTSDFARAGGARFRAGMASGCVKDIATSSMDASASTASASIAVAVSASDAFGFTMALTLPAPTAPITLVRRLRLRGCSTLLLGTNV